MCVGGHDVDRQGDLAKYFDVVTGVVGGEGSDKYLCLLVGYQQTTSLYRLVHVHDPKVCHQHMPFVMLTQWSQT